MEQCVWVCETNDCDQAKAGMPVMALPRTE